MLNPKNCFVDIFCALIQNLTSIRLWRSLPRSPGKRTYLTLRLRWGYPRNDKRYKQASHWEIFRPNYSSMARSVRGFIVSSRTYKETIYLALILWICIHPPQNCASPNLCQSIKRLTRAALIYLVLNNHPIFSKSSSAAEIYSTAYRGSEIATPIDAVSK